MPTIRDVAERAGVAPITASRVINCSGSVSAGTRERVVAAAEELGYVPNQLARGLRSRRTHTLGLILTDITNPFWTTVARGVEDAASRRGFSVIFCNTDESEHRQERQVRVLLEKRVDGFLLVPAGNTTQHIALIQEQGVPVVVLDRPLSAEVDIVRGDSEGGAYQLTQHLLKLGHRRIAVLGGPEGLSVVSARVAGYIRARHEFGCDVTEPCILYGSFTQSAGYQMAQRALTLDPRPTALFALNNFIAIGAMRGLRDAGVQIPDDVTLVGFDDLPTNFVVDPFLTVACQPAYDMGQHATKLLLARLSKEETGDFREVVLPTELIVRRSCGSFD